MVIAASRAQSTCERTAVVYRNGTLETGVPFDHLAECAAEDGALVWLDLEKPSDAELEEIQREFSLHPLAVEDVRHPKPRPKLDTYEGSLLVVLYDIGIGSDQKALHLHPLAMFIGPGFLITLHQAPISALGEVRERWHKDPKLMEPSPLGFLVYRIASSLVEAYFPITDRCDTAVEQIEDRLFARFDRNELKSLLRLRRELTQLRRIVSPQRDVFTTLSRHDDDVLDAQTDPYFTDLVDLILRLTDTIDTTRDRLSAALDSFLTLQSNALNETMKRLTALTVILTLPMIVTGVYGMNFDLMPELHWTFGYPFALGLILMSAGGAYWLFRRNDWL